MSQFTRRDVLATAGALACAPWSKAAFGRPLGLPIGLQPYSVREELKQDCEGTLRKVAAIGYESIEFSDPFYGMDVKASQRLLKELHLKTPAAQYAYPKDDSEWEKSVEHAAMFGVKFMITSIPAGQRKTIDGWKRAAERFNHLGELSRKAGARAAYHNHHFEYAVTGGEIPYDVFLKYTDPISVAMELDCFWTTYAGKDPVEYLLKYPGRFPDLHIKDLKPGFPPSTGPLSGQPFTEVGNGSIDWKRIFSAAKQSGIVCYFVEQDRCDRPPLESIRISYDYLKKLKV